MTATQPYQGHISGKQHRFAVRVYFEDTDFTGVVYHARYLHFMERARSDMLARLGFDQRAVHEGGGGAYAVSEITLKYLRPAHYDDALLVTTRVLGVRAASCEIEQRISRGDELLSEARVIAAFVGANGRARRQPPEWLAAFRAMVDSGAD